MSSTSAASPEPQISSSSTKSPRLPRSASGRRSGLNPPLRRSSLLLAPSVAAPSAATTTAEHSYVFPSENTTSPGASPLSQTSDLPSTEATTLETGPAPTAAEMALRERKDSEASLKKRTSLLFQTLGAGNLRRPRNMSTDSGSELGNDGRAPALASLLETKQKDDASRTTPTTTPPATVTPENKPTPTRKFAKERPDAGSDSEGGGSDSGLTPKKSNAAKRFGQLRGVFGFGLKNRRSSDASSIGTPEPIVPVKAENVAATTPAAIEPIDVPRPASQVNVAGGAGEVLLMSPVMEEFAPESIAAPPPVDASKPEENIDTIPRADAALDLSSPPQSPMADAVKTTRPPVFSQPTIISIPPENEASTEADILRDNELFVEPPTTMPNGNYALKSIKDDDAISTLSRMTPVSSNADLEHNEDDPQYLTRKYASPPQVESPHRPEASDEGHEPGWVDASIAEAQQHHRDLNNRTSFITEDGTIASDSGSDAHPHRPSRAGLSVIAALGEKARRQLLDDRDEGDADSMQNHRGDEAEEDQRVPATPFIMGFPSASPAVITTQGPGRNIANEAIRELITPPITPEATKFPPTRTVPGAYDGANGQTFEEDEKEIGRPAEKGDSTHPLIPASSSALEMAGQYANHSQGPNQNPWAAEDATAAKVADQNRPERPGYPPRAASYIEEPPSTSTSESSAEIHPTTEVNKAMHVPIVSSVTPATATARPASPSPHSPRTISFSLPPSPSRHPRTVSGGGGNNNAKLGSSTTSIQMQPMHSANYGTMDAQNQQPQYPQYNASSSEDSSSTRNVSRSRRRRDETSSNGRSSPDTMSMWDVLLLPVTVPLGIPRMVVGFSFKAFVFGLVCGVTLARVGAAAFSVVVLGRRDTRRPRWR